LLEKICSLISQNKNIMMTVTVGLYILALYSVLSGKVFIFSALLCILFIFLGLKNFISPKYLLAWTLVFCFGIANTSARLRQTDDLLNIAPVNAEITGTITSIPQVASADNKSKFFFKIDKIISDTAERNFKSEKALVTLSGTPENQIELNDIKPYNAYKFKGRLSIPFKAGNPSQFDYGNYLRNYNTYAVFYANDFEIINKKFSPKEKFMHSVGAYRENVLKLHSKYLKSPNLEVLGGIVFGDDAVSTPQNVKQSFINSGLLHILAASGMNVAFIFGFFYLLMSVFRINYRVRVISGMVMVLLYALMTGLGASVIRATCMLLFVLAGKLINRDAHSISLLSFVALLMLIYNPFWINDVGFQLSFIVTFGILIMAPAFGRFKNKLLDFIVSTVAIPIIAQLWVIPIQIFYFNNISLYSVFANIMSVPIIMVLSFGGFVSALLSAIYPIGDIVCRIFDIILNPLITTLINISDFWGKLPNSSLQTSHPSILQLILYYGTLLSLSVLLYKELREKYLRKSLIFTGVFISILLLTAIPTQNKNLEITAFDVGNADCFLIKTPEQKYIMIDTGKAGYNGGKSQAEIIIIKYLKDNGINTIDSMILTHFDNDHCGGAVDLMNAVKVNRLYVNVSDHPSNTAKKIYKTADSKGIEKIQVSNNQNVYENNGLKIINLNNYHGKSDNDNSIITLVKYGNFSMLFTGDAGINGIKSVLSFIPRNITVLKAPHHGAVGGVNRELVSYLNPKYTLISTGQNQFGHPSLYILELLKNSVILRTDICNSIRFEVNDKRHKVLYFDIESRRYKKLFQ